MIFITGPLFSGKYKLAKKILQCEDEELAHRAVWDVQNFVWERSDLDHLAEELSQYEVVIATEIGGGVVPVDAKEREAREAAGALSILLAARAETVIRVFCGIPMVLKGVMP